MNIDSARGLVAKWRGDATIRRKVTDTDPIAAALDYCAAELQAALADQAESPLTPEEFAAREHVTAQAVTRWCRIGELEAYRDQKGRWHIPPHAKRMQSA